MPSPLRVHSGHFIYRREHIDNNTSIPECLPSITPSSFFRLEAAVSHTDNMTIFDKKRPFTRSDKTPYKFNYLTWKSYRVMMGDLIATGGAVEVLKMSSSGLVGLSLIGRTSLGAGMLSVPTTGITLTGAMEDT